MENLHFLLWFDIVGSKTGKKKAMMYTFYNFKGSNVTYQQKKLKD
jgi:hypothetical protein